MRSSYEENDYGQVFYNLIKIHKPEKVVELGVLDGYSSLHFAKGLKDNKRAPNHEEKVYELSSPRLADSKASHGTGCTLSAALVAAMALGVPWKKALRMAKGFVYGSLNECINIGSEIDAM